MVITKSLSNRRAPGNSRNIIITSLVARLAGAAKPRTLGALALAGAILGGMPATTLAATALFWTGGTDNWSSTTAWHSGSDAGASTPWANSDNATLDVAGGGTITIDSGESSGVTVGTLNVTTSGYNITTSSTNRELAASTLTLGAGVALTLTPDSGTGTGVYAIGSGSAGSGAMLTLAGGASASNADYVNLNAASGTFSIPVTITTTAAGITGFVAKASGIVLNSNILNNSANSLTELGVSSNADLTYNGVLSGSQGLQFSSGGSGGSGTITLMATNQYGGATIFNSASGAIIKIGIDNALPTTTAVTMANSSSNGGILDLNNHTQEIASLTNGVGGGSITNNATSSGTGTLKITGSASPAAFTLNVTDGATAKTAITRGGSGTLTLGGGTNHNTYSGDTTITDTGTIKAAAASVFSANSVHNIGATGTLDLANFSNSVGLLAGTGLVTNTGTAATPILTLAGSSGSEVFGGTIQNGTATSLAVTKLSGGSTQTFSTANTYTGGTKVSGGTLLLTNSTGSGTGTGAVLVDGGTIGGSGAGRVSNTITLGGTNNGTIAPGDTTNPIATFNTSNETWTKGVYNFDINDANGTAGNSPSGWDTLNINGALSLGSLSAGGFNINIAGLTSGNTVGAVTNFNNAHTGGYSWALATATSITGFVSNDFTTTASAANFTTANPLGGGTFSVALNPSNANELDLLFTPAAYTPKNLTWSNGSNDGLWNTTSPNWTTSPGTAFTNTDNVTFTDTAAGAVAVDNGGVTPGSTTVTNSIGHDYTINGGPIGGSGSLVKNSTGTLVLSPTSGNTYSGGTFINGGILAIGATADDGALGNTSGGVTLASGTLRVDATAGITSGRALTIGAGGGTIDTNSHDSTLTSSTAIALGANTFTKAGAGDLELKSAGFSNTGGTVDVTGGTLTLGDTITSGGGGSPAAFLGATNHLSMNNAGLRVAATGTITLASAGNTFTGSNTVTIDQTNSSPGSNNVTLSGTTNISGTLEVIAAGNNVGSGVSNSRLNLGTTILTGDTTYQLHATGATGHVTASTLGLGAVNDQGFTSTFLGEGSATQLPGAAVNLGTAATSATGRWVIGNSAGTAGVIVGLNGTASSDQAPMTSGDITVNPFGQIQFANGTTAIFGNSGQTITLHGIGATLGSSVGNPTSGGTAGALLYNPSNPNNTTVTYQGNITIGSDGAIVEVNGNGGNNNFIVGGAGIFSGTLEKDGSGELRFAGTDSGSGATIVTQGKLTTVNTNSNLGTGDMTLAQIATKNTAVSLNNANQSIGNLLSTWTDTTGTQAQTITLTGTALTVNETGNTTFGNGAASTLTGVIAGTGSLIKAGGGTLTLTGTNTYSGGTFVNDGKLALTGTGSIVGNINVASGAMFDVSGLTSPYTLASGQTLGGKGAVLGTIEVGSGATVAPGDSPGILTADNDVTFDSGSNYSVDLDGATAGTQYDQLLIGGDGSFDIALGGATLVETLGYTPESGDELWVIDNTTAGALTGTFAGLNNGDPVPGTPFQIHYNADFATDSLTGGNDVVLTLSPVVAPEPASLALLALGGLLISGRRGDRKRV